MTGTTSTMLERQLMQMSLHNLGASVLEKTGVSLGQGRSHAGYQEIGREDSDFRTSLSRHLSSLSERLGLDEKPQSEAARVPAISKLPEEILALIFHELRDAADFTLLGDHSIFTLESCLSWLAVTTVCREWRAAALGDAWLWTTIPLYGNRDWVARYVERARDYPRLRILFTPDALDEHQDFLHANARRIEALVQVAARGPSSYRRAYESATGADFDLDLAHAPNLQHLNLLRWPLPSISIVNCTQLRTLSVQGYTSGAKGAYTSLLDLIESNPLLEVLNFSGRENTNIAWSRDAKGRDRKVRVPRLRRLFLAGSLFLVWQLWQALQIPTDASVQLCFDGFHKYVPYKFDAPKRPFDWLRVHGTMSIEVGHGASYPNDPSWYVTPPGVRLALEPKVDYDRHKEYADSHEAWAVVTPIMEWCQALGVKGLRYLSLEMPYRHNLTYRHANGWDEYFGKSILLESVRITHKDFMFFCEALALPRDKLTWAARDAGGFLPALRWLIIWDAENKFFDRNEDNLGQALGWIRERASRKPFGMLFYWKNRKAQEDAPRRMLKWLRQLSEVEGLKVEHFYRSRLPPEARGAAHLVTGHGVDEVD
ncbi:unnamed protein product [Peniophora sp. CBMAI 1063]|nr:unnamed protein product [Peniophora sp. CBMAI 1063]